MTNSNLAPLRLVIWSFLALLVIVASCRPESQPTRSIYWGEASMIRNSVPWDAAPFVQWKEEEQKDSVFIYLDHLISTDPEIRSETLIFQNIPFKNGHYRLQSNTFLMDPHGKSIGNLHTTHSDGDVQGNGYYIPENDSTSYIEMSVNEGSNVFTATFQCFFVIDLTVDSIKIDVSHPDTIIITNGFVHGKVMLRD